MHSCEVLPSSFPRGSVASIRWHHRRRDQRVGSQTAMPAALDLARVAYQERRWTAARDAFVDAERERAIRPPTWNWPRRRHSCSASRPTGWTRSLGRTRRFSPVTTSAARARARRGWGFTCEFGQPRMGGGWLARAQRLAQCPGDAGGPRVPPDSGRSGIALLRRRRRRAASIRPARRLRAAFRRPRPTLPRDLGQGQARIMAGRSRKVCSCSTRP